MANEVTNVAANPAQTSYQYGSYLMNPYFDDYDLDSSMYPMNTMMGMNGSIFGSGYMMPGVGMGMNNQSYFDYMKDYQKFNIDYNVDQQKMQRNADLRINASMEGIKGAASILKDKIMQNEQDQIQQAYDNFVDKVRVAYGGGTESEVQSRAKTLYAQMNGGKTLIQDLREYGYGSATQGFIQALTFGTYGRNSAEDNVSYITGAPVGTAEKTTQNLGRVAGAATVGLGAAGLTKLFSKAGTKAVTAGATVAAKSPTILSKISKLFKGKAGVIGVTVAGIAALASFITGKVTT